MLNRTLLYIKHISSYLYIYLDIIPIDIHSEKRTCNKAIKRFLFSKNN